VQIDVGEGLAASEEVAPTVQGFEKGLVTEERSKEVAEEVGLIGEVGLEVEAEGGWAREEGLV